MNRRWFDKAISFACTSCGKCCKSYNNQIKVYLNTVEAIQISDHIGIDIEEFQKKYIDIHYDQYNNELISLKSNENKTKCIFLKQNQCSIYQVRPTQCRTYPYWPQHMLGKHTWLKEASNCEGMNTMDDKIDKVHKNTTNITNHDINDNKRFISNPKNDIEIINISDKQSLSSLSSLDARIVSRDDILLNMIVHTIHDRGLGIENWTYDEAYALLRESIKESPELLDEFESDFFESNKMNIVYETPLLRIVDVKITPTNEITYDYSRIMEFVNAPQLTQTEMYIDQLATTTNDGIDNNKTDSVSIVHSKLVMPVHQVISTIVIEYLNLIQQSNPSSIINTTTTSEVVTQNHKIALIGAGCCALPQYLLCDTNQKKYPSLQSLSIIAAIEPEEQVLDAAEKYFNICFDNNRLVKHNMDGSTFLNIALNQSDKYNSKYDIIIIDAFSVDSDINHAPPSQLLNEWNRFAQLLRNNNTTTTSSSSSSIIDSNILKITTNNNTTNNTNTTTNSNNNDNNNASSSNMIPSQINGGILIMNVYGTQDWINNVQLQIQQSHIFCKPITLDIDNHHTNYNTIAHISHEHEYHLDKESELLANRNTVFILMLKEDEKWLSSFIKYTQPSKL